MNATIRKFGFPATLIHEYAHWVVLLRPAQPTLGSLILAAKSDVEAFGALPPAAYAELAEITPAIEAALRAAVNYQRINYLMLMMVDSHVHFHVIPRYEGARTLGMLEVTDAGWPGQPALGAGKALTGEETAALAASIRRLWSPSVG